MDRSIDENVIRLTGKVSSIITKRGRQIMRVHRPENDEGEVIAKIAVANVTETMAKLDLQPGDRVRFTGHPHYDEVPYKVRIMGRGPWMLPQLRLTSLTSVEKLPSDGEGEANAE